MTNDGPGRARQRISCLVFWKSIFNVIIGRARRFYRTLCHLDKLSAWIFLLVQHTHTHNGVTTTQNQRNDIILISDTNIPTQPDIWSDRAIGPCFYRLESNSIKPESIHKPIGFGPSQWERSSKFIKSQLVRAVIAFWSCQNTWSLLRGTSQ